MKSVAQFLKDSKRTRLNPKFWNPNKKMKAAVREALKRIGYAWAEDAKIPRGAIKDMVVVGGNAAYFWNDKSDLDLHLVLDTKKISDCKELLADYLRAKKRLWSLLHDVEIYGTEVEVYGEDADEEKPRSLGRYSVMKDKWIDEPQADQVPDLEDKDLQMKVDKMADLIDEVIEDHVTNEAMLNKLMDRIKNLRKASLSRGNEFSEGNLTFKMLRNLGYIDRLDHYMRDVKDEKLSI